MKKIATHLPQRVSTSSAATAHSTKQAAILLVRVEFDRARLVSCMIQAKERQNRYAAELSRNEIERKALLAILKAGSSGASDVGG